VRTKRSQEGEVTIDHRNSPGITPEFMRAHGLDGPAVGAGVTFVSALVVCHHCGNDIILNPDRTRERGWCWSCDHYICDGCTANRAAGLPCMPMKAVLDRIYTKLMQGKIILPASR
jgi:hypothetical protein